MQMVLFESTWCITTTVKEAKGRDRSFKNSYVSQRHNLFLKTYQLGEMSPNGKQ